MIFSNPRTEMVTPEDALEGRAQALAVPERHHVLDAPLLGGVSEGAAVAYFAMGCFWGAERLFWRLDGVVTTAVGYQGGYTPNPTYEEICTGRTGHAEAVRVVYRPAGNAVDAAPSPDAVEYEDLLAVFWENHDPTQGMRQGNDVGSQYRSAIYVTSDEQRETAKASRDRYQQRLSAEGFGQITTEIADAPEFYPAEGYHQQYLAKNPHGYCNHGFCQVAYRDDA